MPTADQKLVSKYNEKFMACANQRSAFERQWYLNIAFYYGKQWVAWVGNIAAGKYSLQDLPPTQRWRVRSVSNKCMPIIRNELTKLTKEEPQFYVVPSSTEQSDIAAARAAEIGAEYVLDVTNFNRIRRQAVQWALLCGTGFTKAIQVSSPLSGQGDDGGIFIEAPSTFSIYVPILDEIELERQPYLCHARSVDPTWVYDNFGVELQPDGEAAKESYETRLQTLMGITNPKNSQLSHIKEWWVKPCRDFPKGAMFFTGSDKLLYIYEEAFPQDENMEPVEEETSEQIPGMKSQSDDIVYPYNHSMYPFQKIDHIPAQRFYAMSTLEGVIPLQKEYNRARSQIRESANKTAQAQWLVQKGSVDVRKITAQPGLVIDYSPGFEPPRPVKQPDFPSYAIQDQDRILKDIDDNSGQFEVTHGRTPPGVEAASAIAYLQEENDTRLYHTSASIEEATQVVGFQILNLIQQYWTNDKMIRIVSKNNIDDIRKFKASDIKDNTDFRVEPGSMAPKSRAARQAQIIELLKMGVIDKDQALEYLKLVDSNRLYDELRVDARQVQRENFRFQEGEAAPINSYDNDIAHVLGHQNWMKTQEYEILDPSIKITVEQHLAEHKARLQQQQMAQATLGQGQENVGLQQPGLNGSAEPAAV